MKEEKTAIKKNEIRGQIRRFTHTNPRYKRSSEVTSDCRKVLRLTTKRSLDKNRYICSVGPFLRSMSDQELHDIMSLS